MKNVERLTSLKSELLELFMGMEVAEHTQRRRSAAQRNLKARRGIELHRESQKLSRDIAPLPDDDELAHHALH
ncbi:PA3496 family putative envelope integrity protein [Vreelandella sp. TE19]